jgi:hypothetical protein
MLIINVLPICRQKKLHIYNQLLRIAFKYDDNKIVRVIVHTRLSTY